MAFYAHRLLVGEHGLQEEEAGCADASGTGSHNDTFYTARSTASDSAVDVNRTDDHRHWYYRYSD